MFFTPENVLLVTWSRRASGEERLEQSWMSEANTELSYLTQRLKHGSSYQRNQISIIYDKAIKVIKEIPLKSCTYMEVLNIIKFNKFND